MITFFAIFLLGIGLGFTLGAVWSSEVHARHPSPTGWSVPTITSLPRAVLKTPTVARKGIRS